MNILQVTAPIGPSNGSKETKRTEALVCAGAGGVSSRFIFDGHAEPDMRGSSLIPVALLNKAVHQRTALGKHLDRLPIGALHGVEYALNVLGGMSL